MKMPSIAVSISTRFLLFFFHFVTALPACFWWGIFAIDPPSGPLIAPPPFCCPRSKSSWSCSQWCGLLTNMIHLLMFKDPTNDEWWVRGLDALWIWIIVRCSRRDRPCNLHFGLAEPHLMTGSRKFIKSYSEKKNMKLQGGPCRLSIAGILPKVRILLCSCVYVHTTPIAFCERTSSWLSHPITCFG